MVSLNTRKPIRRTAVARDFCHTSHRAPTTVRHLSQAYNKPTKTLWQRWWWRVILGGVLVILLIIVYSPIFKIKNIIVSNATAPEVAKAMQETLWQSTKKNLFFILPQNNLLFFSTSQAQADLKEKFYTESLTFSHNWPSVLRVTVPPDNIIGVWMASNHTYLVDQHGLLIYQVMDNAPLSNQLINISEAQQPVDRYLGQQVLSEASAKTLGKIGAKWNELLPNVKLDHVVFDETSLPTFQFFTEKGWYVYISTEENVDLQLTALKRLLEEKIKDSDGKLEYIDVRFGSRLFYKMK